MAAKTKDERVADHYYLDQNGNATVTDGNDVRNVVITEAVGIRYKDITSGETFDYMLPGKVKAGTPTTMLALFGARTKTTNTASGARQSRARGEDVGTDVESIRDWFGGLMDGAWGPPVERAGGPRYNAEILAKALVEAVTAAHALGDTSATLRSEAEYLAKINDPANPGYGGGAMKIPPVAAAYARLRGKAPATLASL